MLGDVLYTCFILGIFVLFILLLRKELIKILVITSSVDELIWFGFRKWEYYEDEFGSGDEKTIIHMRICQYTDITQVYDYDKKRFVNYDE